MEEWELLCYADSNENDAGCSMDSFISPLTFLKYGPGAAKSLEEMTQDEIDMAWKNVYKNENIWPKLKALYNTE